MRLRVGHVDVLLLLWFSACAESAIEAGEMVQSFDAVPNATDSQSLALMEWRMDGEFQADDAAEWGPFPACQTDLPRIEGGLVEFDTAICPGYSVRAAIGAAIPAGAVIEVVTSHTVLLADELSHGRMVLRLAGQELDRWEAVIPGPADARITRWLVNQEIPAGTAFGVHVSNHGANNWRLVGLKVYPNP
jgi:hypothetical protein